MVMTKKHFFKRRYFEYARITYYQCPCPRVSDFDRDRSLLYR